MADGLWRQPKLPVGRVTPCAPSRFATHAPGGQRTARPTILDGRARHSVRAVVANQNAFVGRRRRARDCAPYLKINKKRAAPKSGSCKLNQPRPNLAFLRRKAMSIPKPPNPVYAGRARHSVRAGRGCKIRPRRARDCPPYQPLWQTRTISLAGVGAHGVTRPTNNCKKKSRSEERLL